MNGLYPIIRRARRPLIIQDDDSGPPPPPPPVPPVESETPVSYAKRSSPTRKDATDDAKQTKK